jgi:hypothetical protein
MFECGARTAQTRISGFHFSSDGELLKDGFLGTTDRIGMFCSKLLPENLKRANAQGEGLFEVFHKKMYSCQVVEAAGHAGVVGLQYCLTNRERLCKLSSIVVSIVAVWAIQCTRQTMSNSPVSMNHRARAAELIPPRGSRNINIYNKSAWPEGDR